MTEVKDTVIHTGVLEDWVLNTAQMQDTKYLQRFRIPAKPLNPRKPAQTETPSLQQSDTLSGHTLHLGPRSTTIMHQAPHIPATPYPGIYNGNSGLGSSSVHALQANIGPPAHLRNFVPWAPYSSPTGLSPPSQIPYPPPLRPSQFLHFPSPTSPQTLPLQQLGSSQL
ncbi:hypothetical protein EV359DRAFT_88243 [Lentinula novae-zelandiae]|nr:hypothetical protein EV359DRAFT_88243 [Lentinula novae-zelandiae]